MKIIVVGLGRMGSELAIRLAKRGDHVAAVDIDPRAFDSLGDEFSGKTIAGVGFDKDVLEQAGIETADALVASTTSDEANVVIARIAKNVYKVPRVVARSYDTRKAEIYRRLGLRTISTTSWGVNRALEVLTFDSFDPVYEIGSGGTNLIRVDTPPMLVGHTVRELIAPGEIYVTAITRGNKSFLPVAGTILEDGDILYITVIRSAEPKLRSMLGID